MEQNGSAVGQRGFCRRAEEFCRRAERFCSGAVKQKIALWEYFTSIISLPDGMSFLISGAKRGMGFDTDN